MPISCDPNDLATAATCFSELSWRQRQQIRVYLLCTLVNGDTPVECTPDALAAAAACYAKLSPGQLDQIETYLFCQLAGAAPPAATTIYTGDGTLSGNRTIEANSHKLTVHNTSEFSVQSPGVDVVDKFVMDFGPDFGVLVVRTSSGSTRGEIDFDPVSVSISGKGTGGTMFLNVNGDTGIQVGSTITEKVAFLGSTPTAQTANANQAIATDGPSNLVLSNAIRQELVDRGLWKGSA